MTFHISKMLSKQKLKRFMNTINAKPGAHIERETKVGEFWLVTVAVATDRDHAEALRLFDFDAED